MANDFVQDLRAIARGLSDDPAEWPYIPCPTCKRSGLTVVADSLVMEEANQSKAWHGREDWDPEFIYGAFRCVMRCYKETCDLVWVTGRTSVYQQNMRDGYQDLLHPLFFMPELPLIQSYGDCPEKIQWAIEAASPILWVDPSSAANRIRAAVEVLMDHEKIPKNDARGRVIPLHQRIEQLKRDKPQFSNVSDLLMAVKWTGNAGSHGDVIRVPDVLDVVEIIDRTIQELYDTSAAKIEQKAKEIVARKGLPAGQIAQLRVPPA
ncbi:DUF4145 domain-containing protein [Streptomyces sp. NPDC051639]|uniref:DUF4145 domain-containing protein n=1 Tax=Streptomyces sp. NPDC051639 TaxID=3155671 RepID=UPI003430E2F8